MIWRADDCRGAPGANLKASDDHVCWQLFLGFVHDFTTKATKLSYEDPVDGRDRQEIGWSDDFKELDDPKKGLRVWVYGFACARGQKDPIVERIAERVTNLNDFNKALEQARDIIPDGGTCPSAAIQRSLGMMMANDLLLRPYKAALLFTDGRFYDMPYPEIAAKGLHFFGVLTYAFAIAIPREGKNFGLRPYEMEIQREQLLKFVNYDESKLKNFGKRGYQILDDIASDIVNQLPRDVQNIVPRIAAEPYYCGGFTNVFRCLNENPETFASAEVCKWIPNNPSRPQGKGICLGKFWCNWRTKALCKRDSFCTWRGKKFGCFLKDDVSV